MKNIKYTLLPILIFVLTNNLYAQTNEIKCSKDIHHVIDSFFISQIGETEYLKNRDSIKIWFELKVDSLGNVVYCKIQKVKNMNQDMKLSLCDLMLSHKFICLYKVYSEDISCLETKLYFPFVPKRYPLDK